MKKILIKSHVARCVGAAGCAIVCLFLAATTAHGQVSLYTTQEDFLAAAQNVDNGMPQFLVSPQPTPDTDGSSVNGLGNDGDPGGVGTPGSLSVTWQAGTFSFFYAGNVHNKPAFMDAMGKRGQFLFDYTQPPPGTGNYFNLGIVLNYDGHFDFSGNQFPGTTVTNNGNGTLSVKAPYTFVRSAVVNYFQFGFLYNSNYNTNTPFTVDNIRVLKSPPGDYNNNFVVDAADYAVSHDSFGATSGAGLVADDTGPGLNGIPDGVVDQNDYLLWKANFGKSAPGTGSVVEAPEPATLTMLYALAGMGLSGVATRRKR